MARPKNADAAATRARILASALALFSEHGLAGVSIRQIASASGVSLAMVHHYFGSKDDLHEACIDTMYDELETLRAQLTEKLVDSTGLDQLVERAVRTAFRFARSHQVAGRLLLRQVVASGQLDNRRRERFQEPFLNATTRGLSELVGVPAASLRMPLQSVVFLTARYGISSDAELELFTGRKGAKAVAAAEDHLAQTALSLITQSKRS